MEFDGGNLALITITAVITALVPRILGWLGVSWGNRPSKRMDKVILRAIGHVEQELAKVTVALEDFNNFRLSVERRIEALEATNQKWFPPDSPDNLDINVPTVFNAFRRLGHLQTDVTVLTNEVTTLRRMLERRAEV
jgi:hypothetical protein